MPGLSADLVISGGKIITVNPRDDVAEAVAVFGDRIAAVGTADEIAPLIGNKTQVISLKGQTVLPGFIEPHTHFMLYGVWLSWVDAKTPPNKNIPQLLERLRISRKVELAHATQRIILEGESLFQKELSL